YFQAQPSGEMTISIVEGQGTVTSQNVTRTVPAGSRVRVPLDANGVASGAPSSPEPYNNAALAALPVGHMPSPVGVAPALTQAALDALLSASIVPVSGNWHLEPSPGSYSSSCPPGSQAQPTIPIDFTLNITDAFSTEYLFQTVFSLDFTAAEVYENPEP